MPSLYQDWQACCSPRAVADAHKLDCVAARAALRGTMMIKDLQLTNQRGLGALIAAGLALTLMTAAYAQSTPRYNNTYGNQGANSANYNRTALPSGTVIPVRLDESLSSKDATAGDTFTSTLIKGSDDAGLPEGTRLEGVVREAVASGNGLPGSLDVDFPRIVFPDGSSQTITASLYSLSGKAVKRADGRLVATANKSKDRLKFIGIGAGAGLLIGTLTKNNAILSLLLGAGAGYLYNEYGNKPKPGDVNLKQGQEFGVRLDRQLTFNSQTLHYYRRDNGMQAPTSGSYTSSLDQIRVIVNQRPIRFNRANQPYIRNGAVLVPLAALGSATNFDYRYDAGTRMIYARNAQVRMALGSKVASVNGQRRSLPTTAELRNGVTFVPLQFIAWAANGTVGWDEASGTVNVTTNDQNSR